MATENGKTKEIAQYSNGEWQYISRVLPDEMMLSVFINGLEFVSILCTPEKLSSLVVGFLRSEGLISSLDDIIRIRICLKDSFAEVKLNHEVSTLPKKSILTSGCGRGTTFQEGKNLEPILSNWHISPEQVLSSIRLLQFD